jgi:hypothetical protein
MIGIRKQKIRKEEKKIKTRSGPRGTLPAQNRKQPAAHLFITEPVPLFPLSPR